MNDVAQTKKTFGGGEYTYRLVENWAQWPEDWKPADVAAVSGRLIGPLGFMGELGKKLANRIPEGATMYVFEVAKD